MNRNVNYSALILRRRSSGEANRDVWLMTAEAGLLRATVFGGPKSRLRSYASPLVGVNEEPGYLMGDSYPC